MLINNLRKSRKFHLEPEIISHLPIKSENDQRKTLVLDLDETLVHCSTSDTEFMNPDHSFEIMFQNKNIKVFAKM